jgi:GNAT superfamily N-acetyltransferase
VNQTRALTQVEMRPYRDDDSAAVLSLLEASLGGGPGGSRTPEFFAWKHLDNPFGRSFMLVAESEGRVVGLRAFMRWTFSAGGREVKAVRAVDTATHPDYQGRGIFSQLTTRALDDLRREAQFVFNTPNEKSKPGYLKMGWQVTGDLPIAVKLRRPLRFARGVRNLKESSPALRPAPEVNAPRAAQALASVADLEALLAAAKGPDHRLSTAHSLDSLAWRYARSPQLDYRVVGGSEGLAIFRIRPRGSLWETTVAEVLVPNGDATAARSLLKAAARSAEVDHMTCLLPPGSAAHKGARRTGFFRSPIGMTLTANPLQPSSPNPLDMDSWALSLGDVEVF